MTTSEIQYLEDLPTPEHILCVYAHPDDAEFFCGGTLAKWAQEGAKITLFLITSGDKGSGNMGVMDHALVASEREAEARAAAEVLGMSEVIFLRWCDGEIAPDHALRREVVRMIRLKRPDAVVSSDPLLRYREARSVNHPDHWSVAEAVQGAVYPAARDHLNFLELFRDEQLAPHKTRWLYLALPTVPNYRVEITAYRQTQINALKQHRSQIGEPEEFEKRMAQRFDKTLTENEESPRYVEYFRVIELG
ncbi:MAG TPA: PIG-L deacetylase family protein [Aggregatilineales bacterium]|nr:PIG-L deacetylase family protein [Aggregatilineales bacterium]